MKKFDDIYDLYSHCTIHGDHFGSLETFERCQGQNHLKMIQDGNYSESEIEKIYDSYGLEPGDIRSNKIEEYEYFVVEERQVYTASIYEAYLDPNDRYYGHIIEKCHKYSDIRNEEDLEWFIECYCNEN